MPPVLMPPRDTNWDTTNVTSEPTQALPDSLVSGDSVVSMEEIYDSISAVDEEPVLEHTTKNKVPYIKASKLSEVLQRCQSEAEKRAEADAKAMSEFESGD